MRTSTSSQHITTALVVLNVVVVILLVSLVAAGVTSKGGWFARMREWHGRRDAVRSALESPPLSDRQLGSGAAGGQVAVLFTDYSCASCQDANAALDAALLRVPDATVAVRIVPRAELPHSMALARVAVCASRQSAFRETHLLLSNEEYASVDEMVEAIGSKLPWVSKQMLRQCVTTGAADAALASDDSVARLLYIRRFPALVGTFGVEESVSGERDIERLLLDGLR